MKTERVFFLLVIIILLMKYAFRLPLTDPMLVLVLCTLFFVFFPGGMYFFSDERFRRQKVYVSLIVGFFLAPAPVALLYKLLYWPGAGPMLTYAVGAGMLMIAFTLAMQAKDRANEELKGYYKKMVIRTIVVTSIVVIVFALPYSSIIRVQYRGDEEYIRLKILVQDNPDNDAYREELKRYLENKDAQ